MIYMIDNGLMREVGDRAKSNSVCSFVSFSSQSKDSDFFVSFFLPAFGYPHVSYRYCGRAQKTGSFEK